MSTKLTDEDLRIIETQSDSFMARVLANELLQLRNQLQQFYEDGYYDCAEGRDCEFEKYVERKSRGEAA